MGEGVMGFRAVVLAPDGKTLTTGEIDGNVALRASERFVKDHPAK